MTTNSIMTFSQPAKLVGVMVLTTYLSGCAAVEGTATITDGRPTVRALFTASPVRVDGVLDEGVWQSAESYPLQLGRDRAVDGTTLVEQGIARLAWDENYLYVGIDWEDRNILAAGTKDHEHHYMLGDVCELFLKPESHTDYWELYVTPAQRKTSFWFEKRGAEIQTDRAFGLRVAAHVDGTLNDPSDLDRGWTAEMAVALKDLTQHGAEFGPGSVWTVLVARYNYSKTRDAPPELSMTPQLSTTDYHKLDEYARILFDR